MRPSDQDVLAELARLEQADVLAPQERQLLRRIVERTLAGETGQLFQKALIRDLNLNSTSHIGVLATRLRSKLTEHYGEPASRAAVTIELPARGYEPRFAFRAPEAMTETDHRVRALVADAKVAIDQRTLPGAATALALLDRAFAIRGDDGVVLAMKAYCHATRALYGTYPLHDLAIADDIIARTRAQIARPWESWFAEACVEMALRWNWAAAGTALARAVAGSHGDAQYQPWYTAYLCCQGRAREAVTLMRSAVMRAHDSPVVRADLASVLIYAGQLDEAEEAIATAFELFGPRAHYLLYVHLSILLEARGRSRDALKMISRAPLRWPRTAVTLGMRALYSGLAGDRAAARRHWFKLKALRAVASRHVPAGQLGLAALGAGDRRAAVKWLCIGAETERDPNFILTNVYPFFRHLYDEPGFRALVNDRMRLALPA